MSDLNDLLPEERDEQNQQLITSLRRSYDTNGEDKQSLARIRARLLRENASSLPYGDQGSIVPLPAHRKGKTEMQFIHNAFVEGKTWQQRLGTIAAVILVLVLVGSMATLFFLRSHQSILGNPVLSPGWQQVASFSGTGSKTLTNLNIHFTQLWGYSVGCTGEANFNVDLVDVRNQIGSGCTLKTPTPTTTQEPRAFQFGDLSRLTLNTIKVAAPSNLKWYLRFANSDASTMSFLRTLTASRYGWSAYEGLGASGGSGSGFVNGSSADAVKTLGLLMLCDKKGTLQINFNVSGFDAKTFVCDTSTRLYIVHFPQRVALQNIQVSVSNIKSWYLETVRCTKENACSPLPSEP